METEYSLSLNAALRKFYRIIRPDHRDISSIYLFAILAGLVQLSLPLGIQTIIGFVMAGSVSTSIVVLISLVLAGTFLNGLLQVRQLQVIEKIRQKIFLRYAFEFSQRLPRINPEKMDGYYLPELTNRFFDTFSLQKGIEKLLLDLPTAIIQIALGLLLLSFYHPVFIAFGAILILLILLIWKTTSGRGLEQANEASNYKYAVASWLQETARLVKSFKYSGNQSLHLQKTDQLVGQYLVNRSSFFKTLLLQFWSLISFKILVTAAMLIAGTILLVNQQINVGQFIAADIVILAIISSVEKLILSLDKLYEALVSVEKMGKITEAELETSGTVELTDKPAGVSIQFDMVNYQYPSGKQVLDQISLSIEPGQRILLQGLSGSGKSTLFRLLTGSYPGFTGTILLDELPLRSYSLESLRRQTGLLLSSQDIFQGTLLENITMGDPVKDQEELLRLAAITGLLEFIQHSALGLDTPIDPVGNRLPAQLRLRILLMRVLLSQHRLLLLEEPFLHLDEKTKKGVMDLLLSRKGTTILIASADESLSAFCNRKLILQNGKLITGS